MIQEIRGEVYGFKAGVGRGSEVAIKIAGGKVVRFPTDELDWVLGEPVLVSMKRVSITG